MITHILIFISGAIVGAAAVCMYALGTASKAKKEDEDSDGGRL